MLHRNPNSAHVSENASETQIDTKMTFTVPIVSIEQNKEFQESRVHCTLAGIKSLLKIGEGGSLTREGGGPEPLEPSPGYAPVNKDLFFFRFTDFLRSSRYFSSIVISINVYHVECGDGRQPRILVDNF